jgi:hypothetical protein
MVVTLSQDRISASKNPSNSDFELSAVANFFVVFVQSFVRSESDREMIF